MITIKISFDGSDYVFEEINKDDMDRFIWSFNHGEKWFFKHKKGHRCVNLAKVAWYEMR